MTWILILTLYTWDGAAISSAQFQSQATCQAAAAQWLDGMKRRSRVFIADAACHKQ